VITITIIIILISISVSKRQLLMQQAVSAISA